MPLLSLQLRLRGGGGDGGVYPLTHAEQQWMTPSGMGTTGKAWSNQSKDRASEGTARLDRATVCAATAKPLKPPIVVCDLGHLLNKEDVIELMLSKALPPHLAHIKSLKGLHDATLHANPAHNAAAALQGKSEEDDEPPYRCPVADIPLNGRYPFVLIKPTGHVVSALALKQVGGKLCPVTEASLETAGGDDPVLPINPPEEERQQMLEALQAKRAAAAASKKSKGKQKDVPTSAVDASSGGASSGGGGASNSGGCGATAATTAATSSSGKAKADVSVPMGPPPPASQKRPRTYAEVAASGTAAGKRPRTEGTASSGGGEAGAGKKPKSEWEANLADRASGSDVYKSLFISAEERKRQEAAEAANFCGRGIVPSLTRSTKFGIG